MILASFEELNQTIEQLNDWWTQSCISCVAYRVPVLADASAPDELNVEQLSGEDAVSASANAYGRFALLDNQGAGTSLRVPGCIVVDDDDMTPVSIVNNAKDTLRARIAQVTPEGGREREKLCRRLFRSCSMSQMYRHIVTVQEKPVIALSFTWNRGAMSSSRMSRDEAHALLTERLEEEQSSGDAKLMASLQIASQSIAGMKADSVVWRRKNVAPHPCANLVFQRGGKGKGQRKMVKANLPIVLPRSCIAANIGALADFKMKDRRSTRGDKMALQPLLDSMGLFTEGRGVVNFRYPKGSESDD